MSKLLGTDLNGLLDPFESTFEETLHALFDAIVVEAGRDEVPPDLLKLGLQGLHDRKEKVSLHPLFI